MRVPFRVLFIRVPYYFGDLKRRPDLESYPRSRKPPNSKPQDHILLHEV